VFQKRSFDCCTRKKISIAVFTLYDSEVGLEYFNPLSYFLTVQTLGTTTMTMWLCDNNYDYDYVWYRLTFLFSIDYSRLSRCPSKDEPLRLLLQDFLPVGRPSCHPTNSVKVLTYRVVYISEKKKVI